MNLPKKFTQEMMKMQKVAEKNPVLVEKELNIFCDFSASSLKSSIILGFVEPGGYISIHAYLPY